MSRLYPARHGGYFVAFHPQIVGNLRILLAGAAHSRSGRERRKRRRAEAILGYTINDGQRVRWYQSARRHRVGRAHALYVMTTVEPVRVPAERTKDARFEWVGAEDRSIELEIVVLDPPDGIVVIHVMPTALRRTP